MVVAANCSGRKQQITGRERDRERKDGSQVLSEKSLLSLFHCHRLEAERQQNVQLNLKVGVKHDVRLAIKLIPCVMEVYSEVICIRTQKN